MYGTRMEKSMDRTYNFRNAYILKPGFDFSSLKPHCKKLIYATDGYTDKVDNIRRQLHEAFESFDEEHDVVIPVGNTIVCLLAGAILYRIISARSVEPVGFYMGIYQEGAYEFQRVFVDPSMESYEVM